jgi:hypothetical protein
MRFAVTYLTAIGIGGLTDEPCAGFAVAQVRSARPTGWGLKHGFLLTEPMQHVAVVHSALLRFGPGDAGADEGGGDAARARGAAAEQQLQQERQLELQWQQR